MSFAIEIEKLHIGERAFGDAASVRYRDISVRIPIAAKAICVAPDRRVGQVLPVEIPGPVSRYFGSVDAQRCGFRLCLRHYSFVTACLDESGFVYVNEHSVPW